MRTCRHRPAEATGGRAEAGKSTGVRKSGETGKRLRSGLETALMCRIIALQPSNGSNGSTERYQPMAEESMSAKSKGSGKGVRGGKSVKDPHLGETNPTDVVKMTVTLPRQVAAFLRWKAEVEGIKRDELLRRVITYYAKKLREREMNTPPIID